MVWYDNTLLDHRQSGNNYVVWDFEVCYVIDSFSHVIYNARLPLSDIDMSPSNLERGQIYVKSLPVLIQVVPSQQY